MNKISCFTIALFFCSLSFIPGQSIPTAQLLNDPSFESWSDDTHLNEWTLSSSDNCFLTKETTLVRSGSYSANIT